MLGDVFSWIQCIVLQAVFIPSHYLGHTFRALNLTQDAPYDMFLDFVPVLVAWFGSF